MEITEVKIKKNRNEDSRVKAWAVVVIDNAIKIHDIKIVEGREKRFLSMPSRKLPNGKNKDLVHPLSQEIRTLFEKEIYDAYDNYVEDETEEDDEVEETEE
ncbi:MAG: SpoVG family protein [Bacilli bacterium]|nr:SpoVG family protein [Bacilli bacterium]